MEQLIKEIPGADSIALLPSWHSTELKKNLNSFFVEHDLVKKSFEGCNFERAFLFFGESQQSKGRILELINGAYKGKLITSESSNELTDYIHRYNDTKIQEFLDHMKTCKIKP